jgi:4-oxalomesaconate tautomerase
MRAKELTRTGYETRDQLDADTELKARIEAIRLEVGPLVNLGDVSQRTVPKMCLVAEPRDGTTTTRSFIPHRCHASIGVLGAVSVATAAVLPGSLCDGIAKVPDGNTKRVSVEHPSGEFTVELEPGGTADAPEVLSAALLRTARWLFDGVVGIPASVWES